MTDHARLLIDELRDLLAAIDRDHRTVAHWLNTRRGHHPGAATYDGGRLSGDIRDLSAAVTLRPDPIEASIKHYRKQLQAAVNALRDVDRIRRNNLTSTSLPAVIDDTPLCSHCELEPRYRGDLGRRCYDWKREHGQQLPPAEFVEAWRRGKQPKVRVG